MRSTFLVSLLLIFIFSCASKREKQEIRQELANTTTLNNEADLAKMQNQILSQNQDLNQEQRIKLKDLIQRNYKENQDIQIEIDKTKAVLFKELLSTTTSKSKIRILENQLLKLNKKKTRMSLAAYREAKTIVGKNEVPLEKTLNMLDNRSIHEF